MKDMMLIIGIFIVWFIAITGFGLVASDPTIGNLGAGAYETSTIGINGTFEVSGDTDINLLNVQDSGFWGVIRNLFTFSLPSVTGMPVLIASFISFVNYLVLAVVGLLAFRLLRSGGN